MSTNTIVFPKVYKLFKACACEKDDMRPMFKHVYFDGERLQATTGKIYAEIKPCSDNNQPVLINSKTIQRATAGRKSENAYLEILEDKSVKLIETGEILTEPECPGNYPDIAPTRKKVKDMIEDGSCLKVGINAKLLKLLSEALGNDELILHINITERGYPIAVKPVDNTEESEPFGIIMPIRLSPS